MEGTDRDGGPDGPGQGRRPGSVPGACRSVVGAFLLITYYLQDVLGFSPLRAGLAFLPFVVGVVVAANFVSTRGLERFGPRWSFLSAWSWRPGRPAG
jgi:hypothetical protein